MSLTANPALDHWLARALDLPGAQVVAAHKLSGGAIQENWAVTLRAGGRDRRVVIRRDAPATIAASRSRAEEFALIAAAHAAGVRVPAPLGFCDDGAVIGAPFAVMDWVEGTGYGPKVVRDTTLGGDREALGHELGRQMAMIHAIVPDAQLAAILGPRPADPALAAIALLRDWLDARGTARPGLEWALRWAERHAPDPGPVVVTHQDFRTGNILVDGQGLTAVLDWEFAGWSDPAADLGWFCARCWRFSRPDLEGGGIASRAAVMAGYAQGGGITPDPARIRWWEVMAHLRWAVIALQQGDRHDSGAERSVHLALTGRIADRLEWELLQMTAPGPAGMGAVADDGARCGGMSRAVMDLIAAAEASLRDHVIPGAQGDARYHALLVAAALATAGRALSVDPPVVPSVEASAIRSGQHDGDADLHAQLLVAARLRAWIADPDALPPEARAKMRHRTNS